MQKPEISYPCEWSYTVIASDKRVIETTIPDIMDDVDYQLNESRQSKSGKYASYKFSTRVQDQAERDMLFQKLRNIPTVEIVL